MGTSGAGLLAEFVEEGVLAVVGGPDVEVVGPGDAALGSLPEELGVGVLGKFVEADIAAVNSHGVRVGGEGDDAGAVVEFDVPDFHFFGERGGLAIGIEAVDFEIIFAVGKDGAGELEEFDEAIGELHVFQGTGPIFGGEKIIALGIAETFANVFESVGERPANAHGFFSEGERAAVLSVDEVVGLDPHGLVGEEVFGEEGGGVDADGGEDGGHKRSVGVLE